MLPFLSSVDGKSHPGPDLDIGHWQRLHHSAAFATAVAALDQRRVDVCLKVELGNTLVTSATTAPSAANSNAEGVDVHNHLLTAIGILYAAGADLVWQWLAPNEGRCVRVPNYPWQRQRLWAPRKDWLGASLTEGPPTVEPSETTTPPEVRRRSDLTAPFVAPRTTLEAILAESWSATLGFDRVGVHDNFLELGGDSLQATILLNQLQEHLGEAVPAHMLFHVQTIGDLADYLRRNFPGPCGAAIPTSRSTANLVRPRFQRQFPVWRANRTPNNCSPGWTIFRTTKSRPC